MEQRVAVDIAAGAGGDGEHGQNQVEAIHRSGGVGHGGHRDDVRRSRGVREVLGGENGDDVAEELKLHRSRRLADDLDTHRVLTGLPRLRCPAQQAGGLDGFLRHAHGNVGGVDDGELVVRFGAPNTDVEFIKAADLGHRVGDVGDETGHGHALLCQRQRVTYGARHLDRVAGAGQIEDIGVPEQVVADQRLEAHGGVDDGRHAAAGGSDQNVTGDVGAIARRQDGRLVVEVEGVVADHVPLGGVSEGIACFDDGTRRAAGTVEANAVVDQLQSAVGYIDDIATVRRIVADQPAVDDPQGATFTEHRSAEVSGTVDQGEIAQYEVGRGRRHLEDPGLFLSV